MAKIQDETCERLAHEMAMMINAEREALGLKPLYMFPYLQECAMERAWEASNYWGHYRENGDYFTAIFNRKILSWNNAYENLVAGSDDPATSLNTMRNSPTHWNAVINPDITHMGIGLVYNPDGVNNVGWYWCQLFTNDTRGKNYVYTGQYLPGASETLPDGVARISCIDLETGAEFPGFTVTLKSGDETTKDFSGAKVTRNGLPLDFTISKDKSEISFTTGDFPTEVTNIPTGFYYVGFSAKYGYYSTNLYNATTKIYTGFDMKNEESEIHEITSKMAVRQFSVLKTDADTGENLAGAVFELTCEDVGNVSLAGVETSHGFTLSEDSYTLTFTSDSTPVVFRKVPDGKYTLYEKSAPDGYVKSEKAVFFVDNDYVAMSDGGKNGYISENTVVVPNSRRIINLFPISYENSIRVFDMSEAQGGFKSNGLAVLRPSSCTSHKGEDIWDAELVHPVDEWGKWKHLLPENVLKINGQLFRIDIMETECSEDGAFVTVHARHISYDLGDLLIEDETFEGGNAQDFIDFCKAKSFMDYGDEENDLFYKEYDFAVTSDIDTYLEGDRYTNVTFMGALVGVDNCLVNRYGGEIYRDNFRVSINKRMENARDNAFFLRYGVNVSGMKQRIDYTDFCTTVDCADNYGNTFAISYTGDSRWAFHHRRRRFYKMNYSNAQTGYNQIGNDGMAIWNNVSSPKTTFTVKVNQLRTDPRFEEFRGILDCDYGDCGIVYMPELDINTTQKIVGIDKDEILNEITNIELGNVSPSLVRPDFMGNTATNGHTLFDKMR